MAITTALLFLESMFFTVLAPVIPSLKHDLHLSTSQAGALVAMYGIGAVAGAVPATVLAARVNVRAVAIVGLIVFAATSITFGFGGQYAVLMASRFAQGAGGAACWTGGMVWILEIAPRARRGELVGLAFGVAEAGAILGPVVGGVAVAAGRGVTFTAVAIASLLLAVLVAPMQPPPAAGDGRLRLLETLGSRRIRRTMWISAVPAVVLAAVGVLGPLQLHELGASSGAIAVAFAIAAAAGILARPVVGRVADRRGPLPPIRVGLILSCPAVLAVPWAGDRWLAASLIVASLLITGVFWAPLMTMLSDACTASGTGQATAVAVLNLAWPPGNIVGAAGGGAIAQAAGQRVAYAAMTAMLLAALLALVRPRDSVG